MKIKCSHGHRVHVLSTGIAVHRSDGSWCHSDRFVLGSWHGTAAQVLAHENHQVPPPRPAPTPRRRPRGKAQRAQGAPNTYEEST